MTEKKPGQTAPQLRWEYSYVRVLFPGVDSSDHGKATVEELNRAGADGWEAYALLQTDTGPVHLLKRPVTIDPPPDGGRQLRRAPIDPPPDGG